MTIAIDIVSMNEHQTGYRGIRLELYRASASHPVPIPLGIGGARSPIFRPSPINGYDIHQSSLFTENLARVVIIAGNYGDTFVTGIGHAIDVDSVGIIVHIPVGCEVNGARISATRIRSG